MKHEKKHVETRHALSLPSGFAIAALSFILALLSFSQLGCSRGSSANGYTGPLVVVQRLVPDVDGITLDLDGADYTEPQYGIDMLFVEGGTFTMGCTSEQEDDCEKIEKPAHDVTLDNFYIGKYEVTQAEWKAVMGADNNPSEYKGDDLPVTNVNWYDAQIFILKLNVKTEKNYRLPTEAEWEYAARGGNKSKGYKYSGSDDVDEVAWYRENGCENPKESTTCRIHPVGNKKPNELGIYDMSGNVDEWTSDLVVEWPAAAYYSGDAQTNPQRPIGLIPMIRGGNAWSGFFNTKDLRVSHRSVNGPLVRLNNYGFRLAHSSK